MESETGTVGGSNHLGQKPLGAKHPDQSSKHPWWHRIGCSGLLTLSVGTVAILASCTVLILLWRGGHVAQNRDDLAEFWKTIFFQEMASRVITICSAAIRASIGLHISFVAAAIASLILETTGTRFHDVANISIQRASGSNPYTIIPAALRVATGSIFGLINSLVIVVGIIILLVSTFTSTILLTDLKIRDIAGPTKEQLYPIWFDVGSALAANGVLHYRSSPSIYWRFAELKTNKGISVTNVTDTGDTYRAILPFKEDKTRKTLEYYAGSAPIANLRTTCLGPSLSNLNLTIAKCATGILLEGNILMDNIEVEYLKNWHGATILFRSVLTTSWDEQIENILPLSLGNEIIHRKIIDEAGPWDPLSNRTYQLYPIMLFKSGLPLRGLSRLNDNETILTKKLDRLRNLSTKKDGPWTQALNTSGAEVFSTTLCFVASNMPEIYDVTMTGKTVQSEPAVEWSMDPDQKNKQRFLHQLGVGVDNQNYRKREIMKLDIGSRDLNYSEVMTNSASYFYNAILQQALAGYSAAGGWSMTPPRDVFIETPEQWWYAHVAHAFLLQDILQATQDPAMAIQALVFRFCQMILYDSLDKFDLTRPVETINSIEVLIPVQWTGLAIVLGLVFVHLVLVSGTMILYLLRTQASELGNAWQAVAQVVSPHTSELIEEASDMRDKDVEEWAKSSGLSTEVYTASRCAARERTYVQLRHEQN
ncbi:hypothetical protein FSARC_6615 [Fusarium sarcochroum]|uniref:Uncharacterized protein n=1 Tax=Fusarium sarcochroum TaxID=1208366 RepID=A0A8H4X876_9HYPO|nr:hypothetical protein FSARC_6615 [Fusarium sarcochroum]